MPLEIMMRLKAFFIVILANVLAACGAVGAVSEQSGPAAHPVDHGPELEKRSPLTVSLEGPASEICLAALCAVDSDCYCRDALSAYCNAEGSCHYTYRTGGGGGGGPRCLAAACIDDTDCHCRSARYSYCDGGGCVYKY